MNKKFKADAGQGNADGKNHVAGEYKDGVQRCERCGVILIDDRNADMQTGSKKPRGFERGKPVFKKGNTLGAYKEAGAPDCTASEGATADKS